MAPGSLVADLALLDLNGNCIFWPVRANSSAAKIASSTARPSSPMKSGRRGCEKFIRTQPVPLESAPSRPFHSLVFLSSDPVLSVVVFLLHLLSTSQ